MDMEMVKKYFYKGFNWLIIQYYRVKSYVFWGEFEKKHFLLEKKGSQIRLMIKNHVDFIEEVRGNIDSFKKKKDEEKYIKYALEQALGGCVYIVISKGEKFVQFWTGRGRLDYDFPIKKGNSNKKYYYQVLGLLADMDFVRDSFVPSNMPSFTGIKPNYSYKVEDDGKMKTITAYFKRMVPEATEFTMKMFGEIYREKKGELEIKVE